MKININKKLKIGLVSVLVILIGIISFLLYKEIKEPGFEEQKKPVYSYNNKANVNYKVSVKPNKLYETNPLDEGKLYITEFADYINTTFNYEFVGERVADLKGNYSIIAKVQGFTGEAEKIVNIWEKNFSIVNKKNFIIKDKNKSIQEEIKINLDEYNAFVKEIIELSKINCQTTLSIIMDINLKGDTDKGPIEELISPSLIIPLNTSMFQIGGNTNIEKPGAIEETIKIQLPVNKNKITLFGIIIGVLSIALIYLIFFTVPAPTKDPLEKTLKQIFKKHGDRLVALNSDSSIIGISTNLVKSIDDLVRIADEIGKPILYKYSPNYKEIKRFYVIDRDDIYILDMDELITKEEIDIKDNSILEEVVNEDKI